MRAFFLLLVLSGFAAVAVAQSQTDTRPVESRVDDQAATGETPPGEQETGDQVSDEWPTDEWASDDGAGNDWATDDWSSETEASPWLGFLELGLGSRWRRDPAVGRYATLGELRWRVERSWEPAGSRLDFRADLVGDGVVEELRAELREFAWGVALGNTDLRVGRQVLTWGTGDLLFLNDLFPKGWQSFFSGRDDEYLKQPSNAIRSTTYTRWLNLDLVAMPLFEPDEYLTGERLSFFSPQAGMIVAPDPPLEGREPSASLSNTEWSLRLFKNLGGNELALYGFRGFFHQPWPAGEGGTLEFPALDALGASWRRTLGPGLFNVEVSRYWSRDDRDGSNPAIPNDQYRFLLGYEWEAVTNLTVAFQYYLEWTLDHDKLLASSPWPEFEVAERRTWLTNRLSWRTRQERVVWSLFTFFSPTDEDGYLRPQVNWRISDSWNLAAGGNLFFGQEEHTFFSQFQDNSNLYTRLRFNY